MQHALRLNNLLLLVRLGCEPAERVQAQEVGVTLELRFVRPPGGFETDELSDTLCYQELSEKLINFCESREYRLIEKLAHDIYSLAREMAGSTATIGVEVHKRRPPVDRLQGGSSYRCGDFLL